jgi:hypothetical protein
VRLVGFHELSDDAGRDRGRGSISRGSGLLGSAIRPNKRPQNADPSGWVLLTSAGN